MKKYKQILEAINRGIKFALADLEDDEKLSSISKQKQGQIEDKSYTRDLLNFKKDIIDLGLPSGTLWCKYNLGVDPNQLSKAEDWYGGYYAWGELEANKPEFSWDNYTFGKDYNKLTKYCNKSKCGLKHFTDNLTELLPEDDAAYQNKKLGNFKFHIPTEEQFEELINYTNNYWVNNYNPNKIVHNSEDDGGIHGLNGRIFEGMNGNQLFIPATGCRSDSLIKDAGSCCRVWSASLCLDTPNDARYLYFNSRNISMIDFRRYYGYSVRPVVNL